MAKVYSQRNRQKPEELCYDLPENCRRRIFHTLEQAGQRCNSRFDLDSLLDELGRKLSAQYGGLDGPGYEIARQSSHPVVEHFLGCDDEQALDFIEFWFQCEAFFIAGERAVANVNEVFREEAIGYELSPFVVRKTGRVTTIHSRLDSLGNEIEIQYPEIIKIDSQFTHENIVMPCLNVLTNSAFVVANQEMLEAFAKYRHWDFAGAITSCGAAFESVLKTICDKKGWPYDPDRDACAKLVEACYAKNLFPSFYVEVFKSVGTIRNKLGDAHGRGPTPQYTVGQEHVEHLIQFVSAHVVLMAKLANL